MADPGNEFADLMARVRAGDREAMQDVCRLYGDHIRRAVRRKLDDRLRPRFDSLDFTQDVWASVIAAPPDEFTFSTPSQLINFLARVAGNKVADAWRRDHDSESRGRRREAVLKNPTDEDFPARQPSASQLAVADERWEHIIMGLTPPQREIVELLRLGCTYDEIAGRLDVHPKAIQRLVKKIADRINP